VKRGIKGNERITRTESFLKYVEDHPAEMLLAIEDKTDALVRELEARQRESQLASPKQRESRRRAPRSLQEVPF
jgi:hypothetical protein